MCFTGSNISPRHLRWLCSTLGGVSLPPLFDVPSWFTCWSDCPFSKFPYFLVCGSLQAHEPRIVLKFMCVQNVTHKRALARYASKSPWTSLFSTQEVASSPLRRQDKMHSLDTSSASQFLGIILMTNTLRLAMIAKQEANPNPLWTFCLDTGAEHFEGA